MKVTYSSAVPDKYKVGMWAFVLHRISGLVIALYGVAHLVVVSTAAVDGAFDRVMEAFHMPWVIALELLLIAAVLYHLLNGFRLLLFDIGVGVRQQKPLFWGLMGLGVVLMLFIADAILPLVLGRGIF
ncbi:MAG: succinate dehydrogenase, cytochrome b556 subunit [Chloroflexota bacterium]